MWKILGALLIVACMPLSSVADEDIGTLLQNVSVNITCTDNYGSERAQGSGTLIVREIEGKKTAWILTAHHVVEDSRKVTTVIVDGTEKKRVTYKDVEMVQEIVENGRVGGSDRYYAKVVSVDPERDIALLRVRVTGKIEKGVTFYLEDKIPPPGTLLYHCGAPGGKEIGGTCSLTDGIVSRIGVLIPKYGGSEHGVFDQTTCSSIGGSSGGLVALRKDGKWVGMITLGLEQTDSFNWVVPIRSVREWAKEIKVEWLLNPKIKPPTEKELEKIPLENSKLQLSKNKKNDAEKEPTPAIQTDIPPCFRQLIKSGV